MISSFKGKYAFLSNFYPAIVAYNGFVFESVEHAYSAAKTTDREMQRTIGAAKTAAEAKKLGRKVELRPDWDRVKLAIMHGLLLEKFDDRSTTEVSKWLVDTGDEELVEGNWWGDTYWGICKGKGENWLGRLLMLRRSELLLYV